MRQFLQNIDLSSNLGLVREEDSKEATPEQPKNEPYPDRR